MKERLVVDNLNFAEVVIVKLFQGEEGFNSNPPANWSVKYLERQRCHILMRPIENVESLDKEVSLDLE